MSADMAIELRKHNVACVTLYPGPVLTEHVENAMKTEEAVSVSWLRRVVSILVLLYHSLLYYIE